MAAEDIKMETYRTVSQVHRTATGVRLTHMPTGISAECGEHHGQFLNRKAAMAELDRRVKAQHGFTIAELDRDCDRFCNSMAAVGEKVETLLYGKRVDGRWVGLDGGRARE